MLKDHEKFRLTDISKNNEFFIEVNWNKNDEKSNESKLLKFTFPDGKTSIIKKEDLISIIFTTGTPSEQMKLIPQIIKKVKKQRVMLTVEATKDIMKGQKFTFPYEYEIPVYQEEAISGGSNL